MIRLVAFASLFIISCGCKSAPPTAPDPGGPPSEPGPSEPSNPTLELRALGDACAEGGVCQAGVECVSYFGIAGPSGPEFKSCEIRCGAEAKGTCPAGTECITIADGPGQVCRITEGSPDSVQ